MTVKFVSIPHEDLGGGIDALSPEDSIQPGYSEQLINFDPTPEGSLKKRVGFQSEAGYLPMRVRQVRTLAVSDEIELTLDPSINLLQSRSIWVKGSSSVTSKFDNGFYVHDPIVDPTLEFTSSPLSYPAGSSNLTTDLVWVQTQVQTLANSRNSELVVMDSLTLDPITKDISLVAEGLDIGTRLFVPLLNLETSGQDYYRSALFTISSGEGTQIITASTAPGPGELGPHLIPAASLQFQLVSSTGEFLVNGDSLNLTSRILPNGDLKIEWDNPSTDIQAYVSILSAPSANEVQGSAGPLAGTVEVRIPSGDFPFASCYLEDNGTRTSIYPDSIIRQDGQTTVTFQADPAFGSQFFVVWSEGEVQSNRILIQDAGLTDSVDTSPQLCVWGLPHAGNYHEDSPRGGWVDELDSYKVEAGSHLVAGLGGLLFKQDTGLGPITSVALQAQVQSPTVLSPAFALENLGRTRGNLVTSSASDAGEVPCLSHELLSPGVVRFSLHTPGVTGSLVEPESDLLTVRDASWSEVNGDWSILSIATIGDITHVHASLPHIVDASFDDSSSGAQVSITTDSIPLVGGSGNPFIVGDQLSSQEQADTAAGLPLTVVSAGVTAVLVKGVTERLLMGTALRLKGTRTSSLLPIRSVSEQGLEFIGGDVVELGSLKRSPQVKRVMGFEDQLVIVNNQSVTFVSDIPPTLTIGDKVVFLEAGPLSGAWTITDMDTANDTITLDLPDSDLVNAVVAGSYVELDEDVEASHNTSITCVARWNPIETPSTNSPSFSYFSGDYDNQQIKRSTQVNDTLFVNDGVSHPLKFDGLSVYRPGLPRWQAGLFVNLQYGGPADPGFTLSPRNLKSSGIHDDTNSGLKITKGNSSTFAVGSKVKLAWTSPVQSDSDKAQEYTVVSYAESTAHDIICFDRALSEDVTDGSVIDLDIVDASLVWSYYIRLNYIDENLNTIGSAATGINDLTIKPIATAGDRVQVNIRALGLPDLGIRDWNKLEVQLYRTKQGTAAPYYLVQTKQLSRGSTYVDFSDSLEDSLIGDLDPVHSALKGQELGTAWAPAPRATRVTSLGNRLVLGNLRSDPYIDLTLVPDGSTVLASKLATLGPLTWGSIKTTFINTAPSTVSSKTGNVLTTTAHGLDVGEAGWIYLSLTAPTSAGHKLCGWWKAIATSSTQLTLIDSSGVDLGPDTVDLKLVTAEADWQDTLPVYVGADWNYQDSSSNFYNIEASTRPAEGQAARRLVNALNAASTLQPSLGLGIAEGGDGFAKGQLVLSNPSPIGVTLTLPSSIPPELNIYAFGVRQDAGAEVLSRSTRYGSRVLVSYPNFAEVFDNPYADVDSYSDSAIDVNPADGQDITAIIPFFGESAFGAALRDSVILVFKTESIYLINLAAKAQGENAVQKLESNGLGCTLPNTVSSVLGGVMFANPSGVYRLGPNLSPDYIGRMVQRVWREQLNLDQPELLFGHNWASKSQYLLSTPEGALIYNSTREGSVVAQNRAGGSGGSWTTYQGDIVDSSLGFVALEGMSFMATRSGEVLQRRQAGDSSDFRDKDQPISATATLRAMDFGDEALRKTVPYILVSYRNPESLANKSGTEVKTSVNLENEWQSTDLGTLQGYGQRDELSDLEGRRLVTLRYSVGVKRGNQIQMQLLNNTKDEGVEVSKIRYQVGGLSVKGTLESSVSSSKSKG